MKYSVVIPTLNEEKEIGACISSLLNQLVEPDEIIVVDAMSTDRTVEIASKFPKVKVIQTRIRNRGWQRELGVRAARNRLILLADADTIFPCWWVEKALENFKDPNVVAVTGNIVPKRYTVFANIHCAIRNALTPFLTNRGCCFLFIKPKTKTFFDINGVYPHSGEVQALMRKLKGKVVRDDRLFVYTRITSKQEGEVAIPLLLAFIASCSLLH